jgi:hypothetical protein
VTVEARSRTRTLPFAVSFAGLLAIAPAAFAQVAPQALIVTFDILSVPIPLSDGLTAGLALMLAALAFVLLRRQGTRGGRLLSWMLALATGGVLLAATGPRLVSDANAGADASVINLVASPGLLSLAQYVATSPVVVTVTNVTGRPTTITGIALSPPTAFYTINAGDPGTCTVGLGLAAGAGCTVKLVRQYPSCDAKPGVAPLC